MIRRLAVCGALSLQCLGLAGADAFAASAVTYVDLSSAGRTTQAASGEVVRFFVEGSGCRIPSLDSPPAIKGGTIEFSLVFSFGCFTTPPGFQWRSDLSAIPAGTYVVNYYNQGASDPASPPTPKVLINSGTLIVGSRASLPPSAGPGTIDPSYGTYGAAVIPFPGFFEAPMRLAVQRTGVVLTGAGTVSNYAVSRLLDTGAIDGDFASSGTITPYGSPMSARAFAVGADDEIFLAGYRYDNPSGQTWLAIQRYSPSGSFITEIDLSQAALSVAGAVGAYPQGLDIATLPDGRFLVAGTSDSYCTGSWFVAKFDAAGRLDPAFGKGGAYVGSTGCAYRLVPTADNGLLVLGSTSDTIDANFLVKLNATGQPDGAFGVGGVVNGTFARTAPRLQADGRIILGGDNFSLLRLLGNGALDSSFGTNGALANQTGMALRLEDFLLMPDGSILLVGATTAVTGAPGDSSVLTLQPIVTRYAGNGSLDRSFGESGVLKISGLTRSQPSGRWGPAETMALMPLPNAKALLATANGSSGWYNRANVIYRFVVDASATGSGNKNYQGLWWNAPPNSESGWGVSLAHQADTIFATWFTYSASGTPMWRTLIANKSASNSYSGNLYGTVGPPFNADPFDPTKVTGEVHGTGTLSFVDGNTGTLDIVIPCPFGCPTLRISKAITRQQFGPLPTCVFGAQPDLSLATNYTDMWWAAPATSESGWGIFLTHQGDTIFAAWFTYDLDGQSMWLVATATKSAPGRYVGTLYRTTGPPNLYAPFDPSMVVATPVGSMSLTFTNGNHADFAYTVNTTAGTAVTQSKSITREIFAAPGTVCQ